MIMRALKLSLASVLGLLTSLVGMVLLALVLLLGTGPGLQFVWRQLAPSLPDSLKIDEVDGRLVGPLSIKGLHLHTDSLQLDIDQARLHWRPSALLHGELAIDGLAVSGVDITSLPHQQAPKEPSSEPFSMPANLPIPLQINVASAQLDNLRYFSSPDADPLILNHLGFSGSANNNAILINHLVLDSPLLDLKGHLRMNSAAPYLLQGELSWTARPPGVAALTGHTRLNGSLQDLQFEQTLGAPYNLNAKGHIEDPFSRQQFSLAVKLDQTRLQKIRDSLPPGQVSARIQASGVPSSIDYQVDAHASGLPYGTGPVNLKTQGNYQPDRVAIQSLLLTLSDHPTQLSGKGTIGLNGKTPQIDAQLHWQDLQWPLKGKANIVSKRGDLQLNGTPAQLNGQIQASLGGKGTVAGELHRNGDQLAADLHWTNLGWPLAPDTTQRFKTGKGQVTVSGTVEDYQVNVDADVSVPGQTGGHLTASGEGSTEALTLNSIDARTLEGHIGGKGQVTWSPALSGSVDLSGKGINPKALVPDWPGKVNVHIKGSGSMAGAQPEVQLDTVTASGQLRGQKLELKAQGHYRNGNLNLSQLQAGLGETRINTQGNASNKALDISWSVQSRNLANLLPSIALTGTINGSGHITGTPKSPVVQIDARAHDLAYGGYQIGKLSINGNLDATGQSHSKIDLSASDATAAGVSIGSLELHGQGTPQDHELSLSTQTSKGDADVSLTGQYMDNQWHFKLAQARIAYPGLAPWSLAAPATGVVSAAKQQLDRSCWTSSDARLCLSGSHGPDSTKGSIDLNQLAFSYLRPLLPPDLKIEGELNVTGHYQQTGDQPPEAHLAVTTSEGALTSQSTQGPVTIGFDPSRITLDMGDQGLVSKGPD